MTRKGCNIRCLNAVSPPKRCKCVCQGTNHGYRMRRQQGENVDVLIPFSRFQAFLFGKTCVNCNNSLENVPAWGYPHDGGIYIPEFRQKFWVYYVCPKCGYQNSIHKLSRQTSLVDAFG